MSAFGGKADIALTCRRCPLFTQSGHGVTKTPLSDFGPGLYDFRVLSGEGRT